jgi:predicted RNA-binding Zn ribbon-like protein
VPPRIVVPLIGEPLALDLVNTRAQPYHDAPDALETEDALADWLFAQSDRLPHARVTRHLHADVVSLRANVGNVLAAVMAGGRPAESDLEGINAAMRAAPMATVLGWDSRGPSLGSVRSGDDAAILLAVLASACADYLADDAAAATRTCEAPDCELLFAPTHPRRRWCSASVCGNRTRVARYYERHRAATLSE